MMSSIFFVLETSCDIRITVNVTAADIELYCQHYTFHNIVVSQNEPDDLYGFYDESTGTLYKLVSGAIVKQYFVQHFIETFHVNFRSLGGQKSIEFDDAQRLIISAAKEYINNGYVGKPSFIFDPSPNLNADEAFFDYVEERRQSYFYNDLVTLPPAQGTMTGETAEKYRRRYLIFKEDQVLARIALIVCHKVATGSFVCPTGSKEVQASTDFRFREKKGEISEFYISILDRLGFPWDPSNDAFMDKIDQLEEYKEYYGNWNPPAGESHSPLWRFAYLMRIKYADGSLPQWKETILRSINFPLLSQEEWTAAKEEEQLRKDEEVLEELILTATRHNDTHGFPNPRWAELKFYDAAKTLRVQSWERKYWHTLKTVCAWVRSERFTADHPLIAKLVKLEVDVLDINREGGRERSTESSYLTMMEDLCYNMKLQLRDELLEVTRESYSNRIRVRPDGYGTKLYPNMGDFRRDDLIEIDENCHNENTSHDENRKLNIIVISAKEADRLNIIRLNVGSNKKADPDQIKEVKRIVTLLDDPSMLTPGVFLYLIDYPEWHPHAIAYNKRVKPTISVRREEDSDDDTEDSDDEVRPQSIYTPTTIDDVNKTYLPVFDGIVYVYSNADRKEIFSNANMYDSKDEEEESEEAGMEGNEGKAEEE